MDALLDRRAFPGSAVDAATAGASFAGEARFSGCFACTNWARAAVRALLPRELSLATNVSATPDVHPVIFMFGEQHEGGVIFGGISIPMGVRYSEFGVAIPYVRFGGGPHLHTYVPRMYSSAYPAVRDANVHYGFRKELARLEQYGGIAALTTPAGALLWQAALEPAGPWIRSRGELPPSVAALHAALSIAIIGRKADGRYIRSFFDLEMGEALVRPVRCAMSIEAPLVEGLAPGRCYAAPGGAFEGRGIRWRLSWPQPCE